MWRQLVNLTQIALTQRSSLLSPSIFRISSSFLQRNFSFLSAGNETLRNPSTNLNNGFLQPTSLSLNFDRGFKVKGRLRRRCKDCYFVVRQERLYVICKTHPRHKQMSMVKKPWNTWILTDATQSKIRPWN